MQVIAAPTSLGLGPLRSGHEPGCWRAPAALIAAGLLEALGDPPLEELPRPRGGQAPVAGTRLRNGPAIRDYTLLLADRVGEAIGRGCFVLVVGGDCSVLLGALVAARRTGPVALVHVDGHSDFRHPGNCGNAPEPFAVAGMDLALATGRGEALLVDWPGIAPPLVPDALAIQLGEREGRDPDYPWADIHDTAIGRIDVFEAQALGAAGVLARIVRRLDADAAGTGPAAGGAHRSRPRAAGLAAPRPVRTDAGVVPRELGGRDPAGGGPAASGLPFWLHLDVDVMDRDLMPAVDCPGTPGLSPEMLRAILAPLVAHPRCLGMTVTILDPELDTDGRCAGTIVELLRRLPFRADGRDGEESS
ncbi:arginase family protein [Rhizosaccharibacter radicis]|uniref:Arginase family protein n=1 Tax=Rhizosaccharibacter radicis TaxID=2782605 RepID=A0ABT1VV49_9PROT|nr:arginase family protein [Acetobacteraceae bacterium KSS12]